MIRSAACRRFIPLGSIACAAVLTSMVGADSARAQSTVPDAAPTPPAATHLDFTLDTGSSTPPPTAAPAKPAAALGDSGRNPQPLPSRGDSLSRNGFREAPSAAPQVLAQLGTVTSSVGQIRIARDTRSRLLSTVANGTNLAVVSDGGAFWGVLMVNNTMGWVRKASVQLMEYRASVAAPIDTAAATAVPTPEPPTSAASSVAGSIAAPPAQSDLDPRTTALLHEAFSYLGVPYVWAGNTRQGLDCSGFVCNVFGALGVHLPRHSGDQARVGQQVHGDDLRPGDRLYFDMGNHGEISHCGIYIGNGYFIHASTNHGRVDVDSVLKPNYRRALVCACRS